MMSCGFYRGGSACDRAPVEPPRDAFLIVLMDVSNTFEVHELSNPLFVTLTATQLLLAWAVLCAGATLQGSIGFGLGVVGAPLLVLIAPGLVPGPLLFDALLLAVLMVYREHRSIHLSGLGWALAGRAVGVAVAAGMLALMPTDRLGLAIGAAVLLVVAINASGLRVRPGTGSLIMAGMLSGLTGTISSIGGPPMALLYQDAAGARLRSTLSGYFMVGAIMSLVALALVGRFGVTELRLGVLLLPGVIVGFVLSSHVAAVADRASATRVLVLTVSAAAGVAVILRQLLA